MSKLKTARDYRGLGLNYSQIQQLLRSDNQSQWDKFNATAIDPLAYGPTKSVSPSMQGFLDDQNKGASNPITNESFANIYNQNGGNAATDVYNPDDYISGWDKFTNLFGGGGTTPNGASSFWGEGGVAGGISSGLGAVGSIWSAKNTATANDLALESFNFNKQAYNQNNQFQAQGLNEQLSDRYTARAGFHGTDAAERMYGTLDQYMDKNGYNPKILT